MLDQLLLESPTVVGDVEGGAIGDKVGAEDVFGLVEVVDVDPLLDSLLFHQQKRVIRRLHKRHLPHRL